MRKIRKALRLRRSADFSIRQIRASTKLSVGAIQKLLARADALELGWPLPPELNDEKLVWQFYLGADTRACARFEIPHWLLSHPDLKRRGVTKLLLWEEYTQQYPNRCYSYSQFCDRFGHWRQKQKRSVREVHRAGEKLFADYAAQSVPIIHAASRNIARASLIPPFLAKN